MILPFGSTFCRFLFLAELGHSVQKSSTRPVRDMSNSAFSYTFCSRFLWTTELKITNSINLEIPNLFWPNVRVIKSGINQEVLVNITFYHF